VIVALSRDELIAAGAISKAESSLRRRLGFWIASFVTLQWSKLDVVLQRQSPVELEQAERSSFANSFDLFCC
jgi:hypothetical protein